MPRPTVDNYVDKMWDNCDSRAGYLGQTFPPCGRKVVQNANLCKTSLTLPLSSLRLSHTLSTADLAPLPLVNVSFSTVSTAYIIMSMKI